MFPRSEIGKCTVPDARQFGFGSDSEWHSRSISWWILLRGLPHSSLHNFEILSLFDKYFVKIQNEF